MARWTGFFEAAAPLDVEVDALEPVDESEPQAANTTVADRHAQAVPKAAA
jgi:hypothetical protein